MVFHTQRTREARTETHLVVHVGLRCREAELDEHDFGVVHRLNFAPDGVVQAESIDHLRIVDGAAQALHHSNVVQIDVAVFAVGHLKNSVDGHRRKDVRVLVDDLRRQRNRGRLTK